MTDLFDQDRYEPDFKDTILEEDDQLSRCKRGRHIVERVIVLDDVSTAQALPARIVVYRCKACKNTLYRVPLSE